MIWIVWDRVSFYYQPLNNGNSSLKVCPSVQSLIYQYGNTKAIIP